MPTRVPIPKRARRRNVVPWQYTVMRQSTEDELKALAATFLADTRYHKIISGDVYPGVTIFTGVYWGTQGRDKDLSQVARLWEQVEERLPELTPDATIEYLVTAALQDDPEPVVLAVDAQTGEPVATVELDSAA